MAWRRSEGPAGQGLVLVKVGAASEGRAYALRGFCGGESMKEVWRVGSTVAGAVPRTFAQCIAGSHSGTTALGMAVQ